MKWLSLCLMACLALAAEAQERRVALLIGNEAFGTPGLSVLENPHEDVDRVAAALRTAGFTEVTVLKDQNEGQIRRALADFRASINGDANAIGFFYYSGHGAALEEGRQRFSYLIPTGNPVEYADDLATYGVELQREIRLLEASGAGAVFVVIDACRNTLTRRNTMGGAATKGIGNVTAPPGLLIAYSAADGQFADDDSVFSTALAEEILRPGQTAETAFTNISRTVGAKKPGINRLPVIQPRLSKTVCFRGCRLDPGEEARDVEAVNDCDSARAFNAKWPEGQFTNAGRQMQSLLCAAPITEAPPPVIATTPEPNTTARATFTKGATVAWERTFGGETNDGVQDIATLSDGGALVAGSTTSSGAGGLDMWLVRLNAEGRELWSRTYGGRASDYANAIAAHPHGGFLLAGTTTSSGAGQYDMYLVRVDAEGRELWSRTYGGSGTDGANAVAALADGGALVAGYSLSSGSGASDMYLVRVDSEGRELWLRTYGGAQGDWANAVAALPGGGALLAGSTKSSGAGGRDMFLVRVDGEGRELWSRTYGGTQDDWASASVALPDGGALIAGYTESSGAGGEDLQVIQVDGDGRELWSSTYGGVDADRANAIAALPGGGALVAGSTKSSGAGGLDMNLVRIDGEGRELWSRTYGGARNDEADAVAALPGGGVMIAGSTQSKGAGGRDMYVIRIDPVD